MHKNIRGVELHDVFLNTTSCAKNTVFKVKDNFYKKFYCYAKEIVYVLIQDPTYELIQKKICK